MENYQITSFVISIMTFLTYSLFIYFRFGIQPSISDSFYNLLEMKPKMPYLFTLSFWGFAIPLTIVGVELTPLFFLATTMILFTGTAPMFREGGMTKTVHMVGAFGGISTAVVAFMVINMWAWALLMLIGMGLMFIYKDKINNHIWWIETFAFATTWLGMVIATI